MSTKEAITIHIMTSSNGNIFRVTAPLKGNLFVAGGFPSERDSNAILCSFFVGSLNRMLNKYWIDW